MASGLDIRGFETSNNMQIRVTERPGAHDAHLDRS